MLNFKSAAICGLLALPAFQGVTAENVILTTPQNFQVVGMSPNGKWACGVFVGGGETSASFRWNLETGKVEMIGSGEESMAWAVSDDGVVSGNFACKDILPHGNPLMTAGIARGTKWEALEIPEGTDPQSEGFGYGITADGRSVSGTVYMNGVLTPVLWRDGKVYKVFPTPKHSMAYCISPDGEALAGWTYGPVHSNRAATYWDPDGGIHMLLDSSAWSETMFNSAKAFSPDGKTLLYWGGWEPTYDEDGNYKDNYLYALYDIATDKRSLIKAPAVSSSMEFFAMTDSGLLVGADQERGFVYVDGETMYIDDYLQKIGVDLSGFNDWYVGEGSSALGYLPIFRVMNVTNDAKTFIFIYYDKEGVMRSMCLKVDQDLSAVPPVGVKAERMKGLNTVSLSWMAPLEAKGIRGYNIYRDDKKLNGFLPINRLYYYDAGLEEGTYTYKVAAVNAAGKETFAPDMEVIVAKDAMAAPTGLAVRQKGVNNAHLTWNAPESNKLHMRYYDPESDAIEALNVYQPVEMEVGVKYDQNDLAQYAGAKVTEVTFTPMDPQEGWTIVFYTRDADGKLQELASQAVSQELHYRVPNTVKLDTPLDLPNTDLILALKVSVGSDAAGVVGSDNSVSRPGYSDLLRQTSEPDFYSAFESSTASAMSVSANAWALDMIVEMPDYNADNDVVDHYNVYVAGEKVHDTADTSHLLAALEDGTHTIGVEAVYADGTTSARIEKKLDIAAIYEGVKNINIDVEVADGVATATAAWEAPLNRDKLSLSYDAAEKPARGVRGVNNALIVGAEYVSSMLKGYEGYKIESVDFYPMCDAIYTVGIYENDKLIHEQEVYDFEPNSWCTVALDKDITIKDNADYRLIVDAFDAEPGKDIFGVGEQLAFPYRSDLYSVNAGESFSSYWYETGYNGGWLLKFNLAEVDGSTLLPAGYDVVVDGQVKNGSTLATPTYAMDMEPTDKLHTISVNTYYEDLTDAIEGAEQTFRVVAAGVDGNVLATVVVRVNADQISAEGEGVEGISLVNLAGVEVAAAKGNTLNIAGVPGGVYIVKVNAGKATITRKINL